MIAFGIVCIFWKNPIVQLFNVTDNEDANGCQIRLVRIVPFA